MKKEGLGEILKGALLLEIRGKSFYEHSAMNAKSTAAKEIFEMMAREEDKHVNIIKKQYENVMEKSKLEAPEHMETPFKDIAEKVMTDKFKREVDAAGYESAAIYAAMTMEKEAVKFYSENAEKAESEEERKLFNWLSNWEKTHLEFLSEIDRKLKEEIWYDNKFWPMY